MKAHFNQMLEEQKMKVSALERSVGEAKASYAAALRNLEKISDEIHRVNKYKFVNSMIVIVYKIFILSLLLIDKKIWRYGRIR